MEATSSTEDPINAAWCASGFDHFSPQLARELHETMTYMRANHPVAYSEKYGGFWVISSYEEVLRVAQDWETFSNEHGITVPSGPTNLPAIPEQVDPPLHREYKRLINAYFTPAVVAAKEDDVRALVRSLIDEFIESGSCDIMHDLAHPLPGLVFFDMLNAPADELDEINRLSTIASTPTTAEARDARKQMIMWIADFVERRRNEPPKGDVVDGVINATIDGRPITDQEIIGIIQLLLFGGLDTTAGALGSIVIRFCREPELVAKLRDEPELIPEAVEELLRLEGPFIFIARRAMKDVEVGGQLIKEGDPVLLSWVSANRDESEFSCPHAFDLERASNRHIAFGAGPHRCAGSHLAKSNLRIAIEEIVTRMDDLCLAVPEDEIEFNSAFSRAPKSVPLTFTPGARVGS